MHRDTGAVDKFEMLCSIPVMKVQRLRMRRTLKVEGLVAAGEESVVTPVVGSVKVRVDDYGPVTLSEKDVCYVQTGRAFSLEATGPTDVLWAMAPAEHVHPSYVKRFSELKPVLSGSESFRRRVYTSIGEKDPAERFIVGFVEGDAGNWTSFPPHRHDGKPEVYVYYGMGKRFGVQVVAGKEEMAYLVREGDAVTFEEGYHPNVATPGVGMKFVWIISADPKERNLSVDYHPEYMDLVSGPTHLSTR